MTDLMKENYKKWKTCARCQHIRHSKGIEIWDRENNCYCNLSKEKLYLITDPTDCTYFSARSN